MHLSDFFRLHRNGTALRATESRYAARAGDVIPNLVGINHLDENIARKKLLFNNLLLAVFLFFDDLLHGNFNIHDIIVKLVILNQLFKACLDHCFIPGISMKNIPFGLFHLRHNIPPISSLHS